MIDLQRRQISGLSVAEAWVFEPVRDLINPNSVAVYVHWPTTEKPDTTISVLQTGLRHFSRATLAQLETSTPDGPIPIHLKEISAELQAVVSEQNLFQGMNVLMGMRNCEPVDAVIEWLVWHVHHHGADGALIIDRGRPEDTDVLQAELQDRIAQDQRLANLQRVVLVGFDHPLGLMGLGPERHPLYAPDAPGKDRMEHPLPDPWRAPLGFPLVYDLMRTRFLASAKAVLRTEIMDIVPPGQDGQPIFNAVINIPEGVLQLAGDMAYPWALRNDQATHGDHICLRFDCSNKVRIWCIHPPKLPADSIWLPYRILGSVAAGKISWPFWRCMALRFGDSDKVSRIVARTALREDPALLSLAAQLGYDPERQPEQLLESGDGFLPVGEASGRQTVIITTMKNEGPFILEWLAYHRAIGVSGFLIYTNDCTDGTDSFLQLLTRKGHVQWRENPYRDVNMKPQHAALDAAHSESLLRDADWVICMDVDEYIAIHTGDGTLNALYDAVPSANLISLTWRLFGNADKHEYRDEFITQNYDRAAREFANKPHQAWGFKTLFRNQGLFRKLGVHRPKGLRPHAFKDVNWVNGSGKPMPKDQWRNAWRSHSGTYGYDLVSLNHYAVRSAESFLVKRDRGRVNHVDRDQGMAYWFRMNHNVVHDGRMSNMLPLMQAEYDRLMADPEIAAAHHATVKAHKAKISELKGQPNYAKFYAELTGPRMEKLSRLHGHFGSNIYLAGPGVIPDEILGKAPDEEFFFTVDRVEETQH